MTFFDDLKRRNVLRVAAAYFVSAWLIIQVAETIFVKYGLEHHVRTAITALATAFSPAMILAWALEWTPEGIRLDAGAEVDGAAAVRAGRKFDRVVIVILTLAQAQTLQVVRQHQSQSLVAFDKPPQRHEVGFRAAVGYQYAGRIRPCERESVLANASRPASRSPSPPSK